jgi:phage terminase large subunit-like protein
LKRFKNSKEYRFNEKMAKAYIFIMSQMKHYKGEYAGQLFKMEEWQVKAISILVGWEKKDSKGRWVRRFSTALFFLARKNGKTFIASALAIADSIIRGEEGGEVVCIATKRDQAKIAWQGIDNMLYANKDTAKYTKTAYNTTVFTKNNTTVKTLGRDSKTEDGANYSFILVDEYHSHPDASLFEVAKSSSGARVQPLNLIITTAGFNMASPLISEYDHAKSILDGTIEDDNYFAFVAEPHPDADPFSEEAWLSANPNLGVSVSVDFMKKEAEAAKTRPDLMTNYLTKHLNKFVSQSEAFINLDDWKKANKEKPDLSEAIYKIIGIDLSIRDDFTARAVLYVLPDNKYYLDTHFYIPRENIQQREREIRAPLQTWEREGYVTATVGNVIDFDYIYKDIIEDIETEAESYIMYDPYQAKALIHKIENDNGFSDCEVVRQGFLSLSAPTKYALDIIKRGDLIHSNNPIMNWMVSNVAVITDPAGNIKPDKTEPNRKIDGFAAFVNTLYKAIELIDEGEGMGFAIV